MTAATSAGDWTVGALSGLIADRAISCAEVAEHFLARIGELDGRLRAFCALDPDQVRADARRADDELAAGSARGPLHGIPIAVKDLIFVAGMPMTGGSVLYREFVPAEDDAAVGRLRADGAVILGKTNSAEFGFSANQTANAVHGTTRNPWDFERSPGGSSGGAAAAVAAGMAPAAIASDGGGSIRIPASFCGLAGLKPTFGRVPMYPGCRDPQYPGLSGWESVEHIGPLARTTSDVALLLDVVAAPDRRDRHSLPAPGVSFSAALEREGTADLEGLRVGYSLDWAGSTRVEAEVREHVTAAAHRLTARRAVVDDAQVAAPDALDAFGVIVALDSDPATMRTFLARAGQAVNPRIVQIMARDRSFAEVGEALAVRRALYLAVARLFDRFDVLLLPTVPMTALRLGEEGPETIDGEPVVDRARAVIRLTHMFNLTGHPAMSVPCGLDAAGLPIGVQVVGDRLCEDVVLRVARAIEEDHPLPPPHTLRAARTTPGESS